MNEFGLNHPVFRLLSWRAHHACVGVAAHSRTGARRECAVAGTYNAWSPGPGPGRALARALCSGPVQCANQCRTADIDVDYQIRILRFSTSCSCTRVESPDWRSVRGEVALQRE